MTFSMRSEADALASYMAVSCRNTRTLSSNAASFSTRLLFSRPDYAVQLGDAWGGKNKVKVLLCF